MRHEPRFDPVPLSNSTGESCCSVELSLKPARVKESIAVKNESTTEEKESISVGFGER